MCVNAYYTLIGGDKMNKLQMFSIRLLCFVLRVCVFSCFFFKLWYCSREVGEG